jgi:hypothetical protein
MKTKTHTHFDSIGEVLDTINTPSAEGAGSASIRDGGSHKWDLNTDLKQSKEYLVHGWNNGITELAKGLGDLKESIGKAPKPEWFASPVGAFVNTPAFLAGAPDSMFARRKVRKSAPVIRLVLPIICPAKVPASQFMNRGIATLAVVDQLEAQGVRTEIVAAWYTDNRTGIHKGRSAVTVTLKNAGDPLHLGELAFPLVHPAFLRRVMFAVAERQDHDQALIESTRWSYGYPDEVDSAHFRALTDWKDAVTLPTLMGEVKQPTAWFVELMKLVNSKCINSLDN